jgi:DNA-directed RNA polymerase subunit F
MSPNRAILFNYVLPHGLRFGYADSAHKSGKHVINATTANCGVVRYDLPRNYVICNSAGKVIRDADYELWFKRVGDDVWERVGKLNPKATKKTDKELLKEFDVHIKQFYEWMGAILPVMNNNNTDIFEEYDKLLSDDMVHKQWGHPLRKGRILDAEEYRTILKDENHPKRVALAVILAKEMDVIELNNVYNQNTKEWTHAVVVNYPKTENEVKALRSKFYSHIKSGAGLYKVEYV